jgi:hypothetical protein
MHPSRIPFSEDARMKKSLLTVGLLGVLLGGAAAFAAGRFIKPEEAGKPQAAATDAGEARKIADAFVAKLKAGKFAEFALDARIASAGVTEDAFKQFQTRLGRDRAEFEKLYGKSTGEIELVRETALNSGLVRLAYLKKFENGGVVWFFILYKGTGNWKLSFVDWTDKMALAFENV